MTNLSGVPKWLKKEYIDMLASEDLWLMLLDENHTPDLANHRYISHVAINEVADTIGYNAGGIHITDQSSNFDGNNCYLDLPDISIGPHATINYRYGALYTKTGGTGQATYKIRAHIDFLVNKIVLNGTSVIRWNAVGIIYVQ